ncbi:hypothetical protein J2T17_006390 [Paenibacillus mucilaginosus]|uniref:stalk domain-containing protein n=1 Tax=Paenibacillus mucilaginosus TaxID=61624 RepID=UPI003D24F736
MKKLAIGTLVGIALTSTSFAYSSEKLDVIPFAVKILFNNESKPMDNKYEVLNYNGHTYLPARYIAENMSGGIEFNDKNKEVNIRYYDFSKTMTSQLNSKEENESFSLSIRSQKETYAANETINIWSDLLYKGTAPIEIKHGDPLLTFYIVDEEGKLIAQPRNLVGLTTAIKENAQVLNTLPHVLIKEYNFHKNKGSGKEQYENSPVTLDPGVYTIGVSANYSTGNDKKGTEIKTDIKITVK